MSALARWFNYQGAKVSGYDRTPTALTDALQSEGIIVHFEDEVSAIPKEVIENRAKALVIYTPAIPKGHKGFEYLSSSGFFIKKRSQVLGMLTENSFTIAVGGTHGKTTTATMITHILNYANINCDAFLGGISNNINSNLLMTQGRQGDKIIVVEADEYDRSFLTLFPNIAVVTAVDADHLDIYGDKDQVTKSFGDFINQIADKGTIVLKYGSEEILSKNRADFNAISYSVSEGDAKAANLTIENDIFSFDYKSPTATIRDIKLKVPGYHNVENAIAAVTVALLLGVSKEMIREALAAFSGVKRRFEYIIRKANVVFIDDYAHHPVEIKAFLGSVRAIYPNKKITALFQPHLFSRTRDFLQEFAESLSLADRVLLLDIYPAGNCRYLE